MRAFISPAIVGLAFAGLFASCGGKDNPGDSASAGSTQGPKDDQSTKAQEPGSTKPEQSPEKSPEKDKSPEEDKDSPKDPSPEESEPGESNNDPESSPKFDLGSAGEKPKDEIGCDIDFLFVVDNSVSMKDNQKSLVDSVPDFITTITKEIPDLESYHVGVISTDENRFNGTEGSKNCATMGGLVTRTVDYSEYPFEHICAPYDKGKNFMSNGDDLTEKFTCAAKLGAMGSGNERPMDAIQVAFSEDLTKKGACNEGFFREDAILVVVLVTDEEDDIEVEDGFDNGSKGEPADWYKAVLDFKKGRKEYVVVLSLIGLAKPNKCDWTYEPGGEPKDDEGIKSAEVSLRLKEFTEKFGDRGVVGDVCADSYKDFFLDTVSLLKLSCDEAPK